MKLPGFVVLPVIVNGFVFRVMCVYIYLHAIGFTDPVHTVYCRCFFYFHIVRQVGFPPCCNGKPVLPRWAEPQGRRSIYARVYLMKKKIAAIFTLYTNACTCFCFYPAGIIGCNGSAEIDEGAVVTTINKTFHHQVIFVYHGFGQFVLFPACSC